MYMVIQLLALTAREFQTARNLAEGCSITGLFPIVLSITYEFPSQDYGNYLEIYSPWTSCKIR